MSKLPKTPDNTVLVIYTGGTIGSKPRDPDNPDSPQYVVPWEDLKKATPEIDALPFHVESETIEPRDSCDIGPEQWVQIGQLINDNYEKYCGFVVPHGTDTMVYTSSALSFMLENLAKPVIFTGAQRSALVDVRNDATQNLITSLVLAHKKQVDTSGGKITERPAIPEVCVYFGGKLYRANRTIKRDTSGYDAYDSPNFPPLAEVGDQIRINTALVRQPSGRTLRLRKRLEQSVSIITVYPGIWNTDTIKRQLLPESEEVKTPKAVIVMGYGAGNIPSLWPEWLDVFREARKKDIIIMEVSQCRRGPVELGIYETGALLVERGFIDGHDVTLEAALCKLQVLLGNEELTVPKVEELMLQSMAGEQSVSTFVTPLTSKVSKLDNKVNHARFPFAPIKGGTELAKNIESVLLRFRGVEFNVPKAGDTRPFNVYVGLDQDDSPSTDLPGFAGKFDKSPTSTGVQIFQITRAFIDAVDNKGQASIDVWFDAQGASFTWREAEVVVRVRDHHG